MKSWSDSSGENNKIIESGISAICVFRIDKALPSKGFESPSHRCVFVERDKIPEQWPVGENGKPLDLIGIEVNLDTYVGKRIRVAKSNNSNGIGLSGTLEYSEYDGYSIDTDPHFYFGTGDIHSVSHFKDNEGTEIRIKLS